MGTRDARVDAYIARSADFAKPILERLRAIVHKACPEVRETIRWGFPHFDHKGILCSMAAFQRHCAFTFRKAALLADPERILAPTGAGAMGNLGRIASLEDLPPHRVMVRYVREAARLNEEGAGASRPKPAGAKPVEVPPDLAAALAQNTKARAAFERFPPSHKREYIEWITEAKKPETRVKRLATTLEWLAQGKSRNWKYERK